ncbi:hypothetical protein FMEAI12_5000026 [Parafrankia sp. Ea1.12]|uniref:lantibiotic dehydratase n=1 Tax=Parafrankia sp. Ea1.12 TaxID=573499 RepID=UPI000DA4D25C|nr:lantibiotic dehydratase [Parafrankia sp. Ea1.12]SQD98934.1 hypothetical protein FMEAI12_5000026 [Parafrankia sp. Ea1.12]
MSYDADVEVWAVSTEAISRGDFRLRVTAAPRTCTSMAGRFAHLLDQADRDRLAATYTVRTLRPGRPASRWRPRAAGLDAFAHAAPWLAAFQTAGRQLGDAAAQTHLGRGLRAILTHVLIFRWNRLGPSATSQAVLAHAAATALLPRD